MFSLFPPDDLVSFFDIFNVFEEPIMHKYFRTSYLRVLFAERTKRNIIVSNPFYERPGHRHHDSSHTRKQLHQVLSLWRHHAEVDPLVLLRCEVTEAKKMHADVLMRLSVEGDKVTKGQQIVIQEAQVVGLGLVHEPLDQSV